MRYNLEGKNSLEKYNHMNIKTKIKIINKTICYFYWHSYHFWYSLFPSVNTDFHQILCFIFLKNFFTFFSIFIIQASWHKFSGFLFVCFYISEIVVISSFFVRILFKIQRIKNLWSDQRWGKCVQQHGLPIF